MSSAVTAEHVGDALDQAIAWAVKLRYGAGEAGVRAACEAWRATDPAHEQAWQQVEAVEAAFARVAAGSRRLARRTLDNAEQGRAGRRRILKLLSLGAVCAGTGLLATQIPWQQRETHVTEVGERHRVLLADGTQLDLNTGSEAEAVFSPLRRLIVLHRGEIAVQTGADGDSLAGRRPFWVEAGAVRLEAIGTRFIVRLGAEGGVRLHVIEGRVAIHGEPTLIAAAGDTRFIAAGRTERVAEADLDPAAWTDGALVAKQMRLDAFVTELSRYSLAPLACDPAVAGLRVSGVFQLEATAPAARALEALTRTLPVRLVRGADGAVTVTRL